MKIAIDATIIRKENTGTGYYIINLIDGLNDLDIENKNRFYIFIDKKFLNYLSILPADRFVIIHKRFKNRFFRIFWQLFIFYFELKKLKIYVLHSTNYITPLIKFKIKVIVTIHDLTTIIFPGKHSFLRRIFYKLFLPIFIKLSDKIITDSNNSKKDLLRFFSNSEKKVYVTFAGIPEYCKLKNKEQCLKILEKYKINPNKKFLLFVGMIEPRKNVLRILETFIEVERKIELDLVIVGKMGWQVNEIPKFISNLDTNKMTNRIILTGYVPENEIRYLYQSAYIFIYPSLYEGFGIPPLIAMSCGVPVITSNLSSLPEIVGDAAIQINPYSLDEMTEAIKKLYHDLELRNDLIKKGFEQSLNFSNKEFAKRTLAIYNTFLNENCT